MVVEEYACIDVLNFSISSNAQRERERDEERHYSVSFMASFFESRLSIPFSGQCTKIYQRWTLKSVWYAQDTISRLNLVENCPNQKFLIRKQQNFRNYYRPVTCTHIKLWFPIASDRYDTMCVTRKFHTNITLKMLFRMRSRHIQVHSFPSLFLCSILLSGSLKCWLMIR